MSWRIRCAGWAFRRFAPAFVSMALGAGLGGAKLAAVVVAAIFSSHASSVLTHSLLCTTTIPLLSHVLPPSKRHALPATAAHISVCPDREHRSPHKEQVASSLSGVYAVRGTSYPAQKMHTRIISEPLRNWEFDVGHEACVRGQARRNFSAGVSSCPRWSVWFSVSRRS